VRARTNTVIEQDTTKSDTTKSDTTDSVEDEATETTDTDADTAVKSKRRLSLSRIGRRSRASDDGRVDSDKESSDTLTAGTDRDSDDDTESAISDDAEAGPEEGDAAEVSEPAKTERRISWSRVVAYGVLPALALSLGGGAAYVKWMDASARASQLARIESVAAAKDSTIVLLSYKSDTVEKDLEAAKARLTGKFKDSYSQLINDVVIPGAKKGHISTTAAVPAAASVSASPDHAVALLFVNQTAVVDKDPPSDTASSVRVTLDKVAGHWLISGFDPV
jgi:Mce-associated membrane protein